MVAIVQSMSRYLAATCVIVTLLAALAWLISCFAACSVAIHFAPGSNEMVAGITRSRIALHYREGFVDTTPGFHAERLTMPQKTSDFLGEFYLEHHSGPIPVWGLPQAAYVGIEFPLPCVVLTAAMISYLVHQRWRFGLAFLFVVLSVAAMVAAWYTAHPACHSQPATFDQSRIWINPFDYVKIERDSPTASG